MYDIEFTRFIEFMYFDADTLGVHREGQTMGRTFHRKRKLREIRQTDTFPDTCLPLFVYVRLSVHDTRYTVRSLEMPMRPFHTENNNNNNRKCTKKRTIRTSN